MAAENKITDLEIAKNNHQLELKLSATNQADASFYTLRGDNIIEANILNTSLDLPEGNSFKQDNPMAGVKALEINQIDNEHTQILISTEANTPVKSLFKQEGDDLILTLNRVTKADTLKQEIKELGQKTVTNLKQTYKSALGQSKDKDNEKTSLDSDKGDADSDVLIPNPEVVIDDNRVNDIKERVFTAQDSETELNDSTAPATLPRAAAPPVGDMAVSNINTMPDMVDLGSSALVSNLVLRDAPVREVLSMLAKTANLSLVYADGDKTGDQASQANGNEETGPTISLDLDNQPVQEVFNSVLLISGLDANRRGNIIYVGEQLPAQARNLVSRTIRLNQVTAENAALYLASQGAKGKRLTNEVEEIIDPETGKVVQRKETSPELSDLDGGSEDETGTTALMLKGLQVSTDGRLNAITLVGEPRKVEVATSFLTQLDARRRQVSVNVKVIDVNLLNQDTANSSFSYGVNDTYFLQDGGSASLNFGGENPGLRDNFTFRPVGPENEKTTTQIIDGDATVIRDTITIPKPSDLPDKFLALIESRITSGNAKVLTDPTLTVQEGQQATVRLVQKIVETVKTELDGDSGARTITPVLGEAGLVLTVNVDRIDDNGFVSMTVSPSVSSIGATQSFESGGGARNTLNLLSKREVSSGLIRLRDGQTLILSGIIQDQERTNVSKVPILGDIPLLGSLFRSTDKTNERAEVIVLLTPEIVEEDAGLASNFKPSKESREMLQKQGVGALGK
ncbi:type II and III secretion system protein [Pleurocapsa sp. CCALA 161]|nr:type II and III secretion system protein [Pleurocapsa sp. CCALA 161]